MPYSTAPSRITWFWKGGCDRSRRATTPVVPDPERYSLGLQDENVFVVLSGQMQHGPVKRHEYHPLAHSQAEQVGIRNLTISGVTTLPVFPFTRSPGGFFFSA